MHSSLRTAALAAAALAIAAPTALGASEERSEVAVKRGDRTVGGLPSSAKPIFSRREIRTLERRARELGRPVPDLSRWYRLPARPRDEAEREASRIRREQGDHAHVIEPPAPPPVDEMCKLPPRGGWPDFWPEKPSPSLVPFQDYRSGLGFPQAPHVDGDGVELATIEYAWSPDHESIAHHGLEAPYFPFWWSHGDAVLSMLGGSAEAGAVRGLVPEAELRPRSPFVSTGFDLAATIVSTAADLGVGDVLLIEQQAWVSVYPEQGILGPVELDPTTRDAIEAAVAAGVTVVEPAGNNVNGGLNLEDLGLEGDSGALIVSAGGSPQHDDHGHRAGFSNYGERIDFHAQGEALVTAGYGDLTPGLLQQRAYSACFGGTSGAAAIIAAAAAGVQGEARRNGLPPLTPEELRQRLKVGALPQHDPAADGLIGPQPWLPAAADFIAPGPPVLQAPSDGAALAGPTVELRWQSDEAPGGSERLPDVVTLDGVEVGQVPPGVGFLEVSAGPGAHAWSVRSSDAAGNTSLRTAGFTVGATSTGQGNGTIPQAPSSPTPPKPTPKPGEREPNEALGTNTTKKLGRALPAARGVRASWNRRTGRLVLRFRNLAPRAVVRASGKRVKVRRSMAIVRRTRPGQLRVTVRAQARGAVRYTPKTFRVRAGKVRPAAKSIRSSWNRREQRLTLHLRNLAPRAVVRVSGKRVKVRQGTAIVRHARPGSVTVTVRARARGAMSYRPKTFRVKVGKTPKTPNSGTVAPAR